MSRAVYARRKDGSNVYHCAAYCQDGELCGRRVQVYGMFCWQHRQLVERRRREVRAKEIERLGLR